MAWNLEPVIDGTRKTAAAADLSGNQFYFVKLDSSGDIVLIAAATDLPFGVLVNKPIGGRQADVVRLAIAQKISSNAALSIGDQIGTSSDGQADAKTPGTDTTEYVTGVVVEASSGAGVLCTASVNCLNPHRAA